MNRSSEVRSRLPADPDVTELADVFALLSDPGRLRLLVALLAGELRVSDLAATTAMSESAVSHALRLLRAHRVVSVRREGRMAFYSLDDSHCRLLLLVALEHVRLSECRGHTLIGPAARAGAR